MKSYKEVQEKVSRNQKSKDNNLIIICKRHVSLIINQNHMNNIEYLKTYKVS